MKKIISSLIFLGISSLYADYSAHQYFYMDKDMNKCSNIIQTSAKNLGFNDISIHSSSANSNDIFATLRGKKNNGYTFQFVCEGKKGFGYLIINGKNKRERNILKQSFAQEIYKQK